MLILPTTLHGVISQKTSICSLITINATYPRWRNHSWTKGLHSLICPFYSLLSTR